MHNSNYVADLIKAIKAQRAGQRKSYIATGISLIELQEAVGHGGWEKLFKPSGALSEEFQSADTPAKYIAIAKNTWITNTANLRYLPSNFTTAYLLAPYDAEWLDEAKAAGLLHPDVKGREIKKYIDRRRQLGPRAALLAVLAKAMAAVDKGGTTGIEQARAFVFMGDHVVTYNKWISISVPLPEDTGLHMTVNAEKLYKALQKFPDKDWEFKQEDDGNLSVATDLIGVLVKADPLGEMLEDILESMGLGNLKEKGWRDLPEDFDEAIRLCLFGASKDLADVAYNCLCFERDTIVCTDNWRVSRYTFEKVSPFAGQKFLVPIAVLEELVGRDIKQVQLVGSWAHFRDGDGLVFSTWTIAVDFPDCHKFFDMPGKTITLPEGMPEALEHVLVFSPGKHDTERLAEIHFKKDKVVCISEDNYGRIERTVPAPGLVTNIPKLLVNPVFFIQILKHVTKMKVAKGGKRVLFQTGNFEHVMNLPREKYDAE